MTEDATAAARLCAGGSASVDRNSSDVKEAFGSMSKLNPTR